MGVKPYYSDDLVTIYHGDCREWMPFIPSPLVIVTDPPYGIGYSQGGGGGGWAPGRKSFVGAVVHGDDAPFDPAPILAFGVPTVLFGGNHYADQLPPVASWLVWDKRDGDSSNDFADCELAWTNLGGPARLFSHRWKGLVKDSERGVPRVHPTQKPVAVMRWVIERCPDGTILDPYMGSGSTLVAAKSLNRRAIGIEIEERYCEIAANRCRQEVLGLTA